MRIIRWTWRSLATAVLVIIAAWTLAPKFRNQHELAETRSVYMLLGLLVVIIVDWVGHRIAARRFARR